MNGASVRELDKLPDVLTVLELSAFLRIGKNKAYELLNSGEIPYFRLGRKILIPKVKIVDLLERACYTHLV